MTLSEPTRSPSDDRSRDVVDDFIPNPRGHLELSDSVVLAGEMLEDCRLVSSSDEAPTASAAGPRPLTDLWTAQRPRPSAKDDIGRWVR